MAWLRSAEDEAEWAEAFPTPAVARAPAAAEPSPIGGLFSLDCCVGNRSKRPPFKDAAPWAREARVPVAVR